MSANGSAPAQTRASKIAEFKISAQQLETALAAFGEVTRLQILYETEMTHGRRSVAVNGTFSHDEALRLLLSGTGLDFTYTAEHAFTLVYARQASTRPISDYYPFLGGVQARIVTALCQNYETRPGAFRIAMQFRIKPDGRIESPVLLGSTGAARRDDEIRSLLTTLAFDTAPPADMPQPITLVLKAGAPNGTDECPGEAR